MAWRFSRSAPSTRTAHSRHNLISDADHGALVVSAAPGVLGGMRAQIALQISLNKLGLLVIPNSFALGLAYQAFDEQRRLKDGNADQNVRGVGAALVTTASSLAPKSNHSECGTYPDEAAHLVVKI